jgi:AraC-like DNA-binding protein
MALGACYRGLTQYSCHGGISVIAAPAQWRNEEQVGYAVVSSCAFSPPDKEEGWIAARDHAKDLGIDVESLQLSYEGLPQLTTEKMIQVKSIVEVAASLISEIGLRVVMEMKELGDTAPSAQSSPDADDLHKDLQAALQLSQDNSFRSPGKSSRSTLIEMVKATVHNNPAMQLSVAAIARAANLTPNHFSTLFRKETGQSFMEFLTDTRISFSKTLLKDLRLTVEEVAYQTGFRDGTYFSRRFKQQTGMTPTAWRGRTK